jgi:ABC-type dipeptide/oligopeptide/nickel transport system permease subunit
MTPIFIRMFPVLFETEQYVSRATASFQHLTGYTEQIARSIVSNVLYGSQDVLEISGGLWNLDRFM